MPAAQGNGELIIRLDAYSGYRLVDPCVCHSYMRGLDGNIIPTNAAWQASYEIQVPVILYSHSLRSALAVASSDCQALPFRILLIWL